VVSGAFTQLGDIVRKRLNEGKVGFHASSSGEEKEANILSKARTSDFIAFGFEPEFIGRLPVRVALDELTEEDLVDILKHSEGSILRQYREGFEGYGMEVTFSHGAHRAVAARAIEEATGARGLVTVLEESLREFKFHLPGSQVERIAVTKELIDDPKAYLKKLEADPDYGAEFFIEAQVREFEEEFEREYGHRIVFDRTATKKAIELARAEGVSLAEYLTIRLSDYSYGLDIIRKQTGQTEFTITADMLDRPVEALEDWIKETLGKGQDAKSEKLS